MKPSKIVVAALFVSVSLAVSPHTFAADKSSGVAFPATRPAGGSFMRPRADEALDVSPPGFCWWRVAARGKAQYRLTVTDASGGVAYRSGLLGDPVCVPDRVLPAGRYAWTVEALDLKGNVVATQAPRHFTIQPDAYAQPWVPAEDLLARVPKEHPRLLFPKARLDQVRATLSTTRREAFESLQSAARSGLKLDLPAEPNYDEIKDPAKRRLAYVASFQHMRRYHDGAMRYMALMYLLSGEKEYGQKAKALLLDAAEWDPEGISSVMAPYGDEIGLGLAKSAALTYDWIYDLMSDAERAKAKRMLIARADQMLRRLERRDFLYRPESSHDGRLPGYLFEHSIALAEEPRAAVWTDYALRTVLTVFPHWAGQDGGWAEGLSYGTAYNTIFITPFESLRAATGMDVWQRPFYRRLPYFFVYNVSPLGEIFGFGDSYDGSAPGRAGGLRGLLQFHAERCDDGVLLGWVDLLRDSRGRRPSYPALPGLILPQTTKPESPDALPPDAVFHGVGWAALHTHLAEPETDLMVAFKSSPYGGVSHSYADQNGFSILKGGHALARPGGSRYPHHGTPFHTKYTQQTVAQNSILVDGHGQINRRDDANGRIVGFESRPHFGYVAGDAAAAYGPRLKRFTRHVLLVRPSVVCIVDDLEAPEAVPFQWLMHAAEKLDLDEAGKTHVSHRGGAEMTVRLLTAGGFTFDQTDQWPLDPKTGYPTATRQEPTKLWHFTAATRGRSATRRIAAVMVVGADGERPDCQVSGDPSGVVTVEARSADARTTVKIHLDAQSKPVLDVRCRPNRGEVETLVVPQGSR